MATIRPFAYNIGSVLSGTTQYGTLAVGVDRNLPYSGNYGGLRWWMGPDEDLGYCIGTSVPDNDQPTEPGIIPPFGNVEFWRTESFSDSEFISLSNNISGQNFTSSSEAVTWLNDNGYWTSYGGISPSPTPTPTQTSTNTPTPSVTPTSTLTPTPSSTPSDESLVDPIITENDEYIEVGNEEYLMFVDPVEPSPTPTTTPTQTVTPTITPTITPTSSEVPVTPTPSVTETPTSTPTPSVTPSSGPTPSGFTITISEVGSDVVMSASGTLNINDLTFVNSSTFTGPGGLGVDSATFIMGGNGDFSTYSGFTTTPSNLGSGSGTGASSGSGDVFGIIFQGTPPYELVVPSGYTTGDFISSTQTFNSQTFSSMGLVPGTYTYTWGSGANADSINVVVGGPAPTPTPTPTQGVSGDFNVTITQVGPDVVWNGSGSFNLDALTSAGSNTMVAGFQASQAIWAIGPNASVDTYSGTITYPTTFGSGSVGVTSSSGSTFGILPGGSGRLLYVPSGYVSNTTISGSATYASQTIAGMGLTSGTYTWSWGSGGNTSTLVMTIG